MEGQGFSPSKGFGLYKYFSYHGVFYPRLLGFRKKNSCIPLGYLIYIRHNLSPGGRHGNPLQYSCLEKPPIGRGAWQVVCHGVTDIQTQLSDSAQHSTGRTFIFIFFFKNPKFPGLHQYQNGKIPWGEETKSCFAPQCLP